MSMYEKKPLQYCKVISLQLIKINEEKKETGEGVRCVWSRYTVVSAHSVCAEL